MMPITKVYHIHDSVPKCIFRYSSLESNSVERVTALSKLFREEYGNGLEAHGAGFQGAVAALKAIVEKRDKST
jgi:hypothetical protein